MPKDYARKNYTRHPLRKSEKRNRVKRVSVRGRRSSSKSTVSLFKKIIYSLGALAVLVGIGYGVFLTPVFAVQNIEISGTDNTEFQLLVNQWVAQLTEKTTMGLQSNHMFVVPTDDLEDVLGLDKRVDSVVVTKKFPNTLVINVTEFNPQVVYARDGRFYLLNEEGRVVDIVSENTRVDLPLILGTSTDEALLPSDTAKNERIISESATRFMSELNKEFPKFFPDITLTQFTFVPDSIELYANTSLGWYILFDPNVDLNIQLSNLSRVYNEKISNRERKSLEYIDVRLENYVYYK